MKLYAAIAALLAVGVVAASHSGPALRNSAPPTPTQTIVDLAAATPELSTLYTALKAADFLDELSGNHGLGMGYGGPFTVFAPSNEAFDALPAGTVANLLKPENKAQLVDLLNYHVIHGYLFTARFYDMEMFTTQEGKDVTVRLLNDDVFVNNAQIKAKDVQADNGIVHIIDTVLMPGSAPAPPKTITELAIATPELSIFVGYLNAAFLDGLFNQLSCDPRAMYKGPFTVFAPTNKAFEALPTETLENLFKSENLDQLVDLLKYHVALGDLPSKKIMDMGMITTLEGKQVTARRSGHDLLINSAKVITADARASCGVVHIIDAVLMPGSAPAPPAPAQQKTIVELAIATPELSTLVTALKAADLVATLSAKGPFTVFAPTNSAFEALPAGTLANLLKPENKAKLTDLLTYHVISGDLPSQKIMDMGMIKTLEGKDVTARRSGNDLLINSAKVVLADAGASNGVVHIIDAVLMPGSAPAPQKTMFELATATLFNTFQSI